MRRQHRRDPLDAVTFTGLHGQGPHHDGEQAVGVADLRRIAEERPAPPASDELPSDAALPHPRRSDHRDVPAALHERFEALQVALATEQIAGRSFGEPFAFA